MHSVRYNDNAKAYRFYNLSSKTIIISRDVKFHEESHLQNIRERESTNKRAADFNNNYPLHPLNILIQKLMFFQQIKMISHLIDG